MIVIKLGWFNPNDIENNVKEKYSFLAEKYYNIYNAAFLYNLLLYRLHRNGWAQGIRRVLVKGVKALFTSKNKNF